ncbi:MAG: WbqC family protein [Salinivirgaceae bacterium]|nr:WbqC family protein [Salinivirgaceae bacterium]MBQ4292911.1 WbqC family protein [Muribaculaceae bacterium]
MASPLTIFPDSTAVAPLAYCGSVDYYARMAAFGRMAIDLSQPFNRHDHTSRRCEIVGPSGRQRLSVPTRKPSPGSRATIGDLEVDFILDWRRNHWGALFSAYGRSPFFEYYADRFHDVYERQFPRLADYCLALDSLLRQILGIETDVEIIHSRHDLLGHTSMLSTDAVEIADVEYYQVWAARHGFQPRLSALDLVFNMGPESPLVLRGMLR